MKKPQKNKLSFWGEIPIIPRYHPHWKKLCFSKLCFSFFKKQSFFLSKHVTYADVLTYLHITDKWLAIYKPRLYGSISLLQSVPASSSFQQRSQSVTLYSCRRPEIGVSIIALLCEFVILITRKPQNCNPNFHFYYNKFTWQVFMNRIWIPKIQTVRSWDKKLLFLTAEYDIFFSV